MKSSTRFVASIVLLACAPHVLADGAAPVKLPEQYAEVVLGVEGMI